MIRLEDVTTQYEDQVVVLRDVSLTIEKGKITCILGSNGAGKTTLLKTIVRLVKPAAGRIYFEDRRLDTLRTHLLYGRSVHHYGPGCAPETPRGAGARNEQEQRLII